VHAMVRGHIYCGDLYYADLITETMAQAGQQIGSSDQVLDFGCSSGRVVMPLARAYPESRFHACDPLVSAIQWAAENIPEVSFSLSHEQPQLCYPEQQFDLVYAISIWSHFGQQSGLAWLQEMKRILKPDGLLLWTSHGFGSVAYYQETGLMAATDIQYTQQQLVEHGFCFHDIYASNPDWELQNPDWGQSFINPQFVLTQMLDGWKLLTYSPRRAEANQDVYLFQKQT